MPSGGILTCEEEQTDPRSVNGCLGDILQGRERSCLRMFVLQQPPPRTVAMWHRGWRLSARPQKKRPAHTACRPAVFSALSSCIPSFAGTHIFPSFLCLSPLYFLHPPALRPTAAAPPPGKTGSRCNCISVQYFRTVGGCFIYHAWTRAVADSGRDGAQYVSRRVKVMGSWGCEIHRVTPRMCVFIPQMHQLVKQFLSVLLMSWYHELGLNNGQLSCDWLMAMWAGPWELRCLRLRQVRDGWCTHFLPLPAHLRTIYREAFQCLDSV